MLQLPSGFVPAFAEPAELDRALWFVFLGHHLLVIEDNGRAHVPTGPIPPLATAEPLRRLSMGHWNGRPCLALELPETLAPPPGMACHGLRRLWGLLDDTELGLAGQASQLLEWDRGNQFCGRCATPTTRRDHERARHCPRCGISHYPRHAPAVMVRITRGDEILLARSPRFAPGVYSVLAGFVDPGESIEQAAHREVFEEVGLTITNLRYLTSQSWPFPHSLMIGFAADWAGGEIVLEDPEIEAASWYTRDDLPGLPGSMSIARTLIEDWRNPDRTA
ncbi:MAG: NAD(+) diphosphatase [Candidatus Competibacterales bacterium]|nr:NAD(+) diphosphatase [Candidatus Competibacterales bacterium]